MGEPRYYKAHKDNCMQCCLCYLLDKDLDNMLNIAGMPEEFQENWFMFLNEYLHTNYGKVLVPMMEGEIPTENGISLMASMDGRGTHAVVIDPEDNVIWDPNPENPVYEKTVMRLALL